MEALRFVAWPGDLVIPEGSSWEDSEAIRAKYFEKGRMESVEWQDVASRLLETDEYEIGQATIALRGHNATILTLELLKEDRSDSPTIRITAERMRFFLGSERELSRDEFLSLARLTGGHLRSAVLNLPGAQPCIDFRSQKRDPVRLAFGLLRGGARAPGNFASRRPRDTFWVSLLNEKPTDPLTSCLNQSAPRAVRSH